MPNQSIELISPDLGRYLVNLTQLDLSNNLIERIEHLDRLPHLRKLVLTSNKISRLDNVDKLQKLEYLLIQSNYVSLIDEVEKLRGLTRLSTLYFQNIDRTQKNPICFVDNYRTRVLEVLPSLRNLDGERIRSIVAAVAAGAGGGSTVSSIANHWCSSLSSIASSFSSSSSASSFSSSPSSSSSTSCSSSSSSFSSSSSSSSSSSATTLGSVDFLVLRSASDETSMDGVDVNKLTATLANQRSRWWGPDCLELMGPEDYRRSGSSECSKALESRVKQFQEIVRDCTSLSQNCSSLLKEHNRLVREIIAAKKSS
ncbi:hypothetical protein CBR_g49520 [Chara braunii]|uniref:U2A'/phosphoprotein 32 family A C-terminal domain-containing protein n=1 Tax=Chara braunii TaxID=69332 RepID=A0A388M513_CHABU|nr:hypothetical protein CBR_g49520 [Chara braunii]|eukprot:GBG89667.1 hypothetical protein CBR_g49520 [Chara braunii]